MRPTPNWELKGCCNQDQYIFLITVGACTVVIPVLWRTFLMTPFRLITVFLHQLSHAIGCKLTCGTVERIKVDADFIGTTTTRGGITSCILLAGYIGSSLWGMILILASTNSITAHIATGCLIASLLIVLFVAKNWTIRGLCIGFIVFLAVMWVIEAQTGVRLVRYTIVFIGVMNSLFTINDMFDDLISRKVQTSDADKFAEVWPCCNFVGWGMIWIIISVAFLVGAMYLGLLLMTC